MEQIAVVMRTEDVGKGPRDVPVRWYGARDQAHESLRAGEWLVEVRCGC